MDLVLLVQFGINQMLCGAILSSSEVCGVFPVSSSHKSPSEAPFYPTQPPKHTTHSADAVPIFRSCQEGFREQ